MKRKTSELPTRVYSYGAFEPKGDPVMRKQYEDQLWLAHRYRNTLIEIERWRREEYQQIIRKYGDIAPLQDEVDRLATALDEARATLKQKRKGVGRRADTKAEASKVRELVSEIKTARAKLKEEKVRIANDPNREADLADLKARANNRIIAERDKCGVYWGTYLLVEAASIQSAQRAKIEPPKFRRWDHSGTVAVQLQHGIDVDKLMSGADQRIRMMPLEPHIASLPTHQRRKQSITGVQLRIGSDVNRKPVWLNFRILYRRPLPPDARILWAKLIRRRIGYQYDYVFQITVESATFFPKENASNSTVALDVGWRRKTDGTVRVAYWADDGGQSGEILVPEKTIAGLEKTRSLKSIMDRNRDSIAATLIRLRENSIAAPWYREATAYTFKWKSRKRFIKLLDVWRTQRFDGDADAFAALESWTKQERHLLAWCAHQTDRRINHRNYVYQNIAVQFARAYKRVIVERFDLTTFAKHALPEDGFPSDGNVQRRTARIASPGILRSYLRRATEKYGSSYEERDAHYTTLRCHLCGFTSDWDPRPSIEHKCDHCGETWDQDYNAAMNLLASADEPRESAEPLALENTNKSANIDSTPDPLIT